MTAFNGKTTAEEVAQGKNLRGKVALVTGASSGLGFETARVLASIGARVIITARSEEKAAEACEALQEAVPGAEFATLVLELSELDQVRSAAAELLAREAQIDLLINNAGIMACPLGRTREGCELQFGTNHIGHFLFTCLIAPALKKSPSPRVVNLSSAGHKYAPVDFDDPHYNHRDYDKWNAYGQAKTANIWFSLGLTRRGIASNAVHPGAIMTNLGRHMTEADFESFGSQAHESGFEFKSVEQGAATSVWAATAPELEGKGGLYLEDCQIGEPVNESTPASGYADYALDEQAAERLWSLSEEIVGERFTLA
ncbi:NAD(P)-dependent dehydrogenase (short-subunit alcohol dehydrogenase family) [Litorivivens lipolytica]|uniref:Probable oxidoreductase n=1 Tax=Litorivivens lipolytica TaxID=1524264 RepID=A0A7W4Z720_9GAMM|nr:SDR family NAD(P)-dependent oxidoreductase [Litorivivens lipolytica]MBB3047570.1 NAD(P)-dependent dehydrogenase (short-subunit alcohol dehydrogenase family) [Litorivivens lipolytica]